MGAGFAWLFLRALDAAALRRVFSEISAEKILLALVFMVVGWGFRITRWWWMLRALRPGVELRAAIGPFLAGMAVNNVLPLRAGDFLRILGFRRKLGMPAMAIGGTLVIERVLDVAVLAGVFLLGLAGLPEGAIPPDLVAVAIWLGGLGIGTLVALMFFPTLLDRVRERLGSRGLLAGRPWAADLMEQGARLAEALRLTRSPGRMSALLGLSVAGWAMEGALFWTVASAVGAGAALAGPWFALAVGTLATAMPGMPGYIGTFDYFAAQGLEAYGASPEHAAAFALTVHALLWVSSTVAGLPWVLRSRLSPSAPPGEPRRA